ncbi:MAG: replication restart helicase PriA [Bacteroidales bacterium]
MIDVVNILLPLPLKTTFSYIIPESLLEELEIGKRAIVPFGQKKFYSGIIVSNDKIDEKNIDYELKEIVAIVDDNPIINKINLKFWNWIADYYFASIGNVMNNALPSLFKVASETYLVVNPNFDGNISDFTEEMLGLFDLIKKNNKLAVDVAVESLDFKGAYKVLDKLIVHGAVELSEEIHNPYKPKFEDFISINDKYIDEKKLHELFTSLEKRAFKQLEFLLAYFQVAPNFEDKFPKVPKSLIYKHLGGANTAVLKALKDKNIINVTSQKVSRLQVYDSNDSVDNIILTPHQQMALDSINNLFKENKTVLLHGITSSGKTEIYFKLINEALEKKQQILFLVPEIALTTQLVDRTVKYFGDKVGVYHSKFNHNERLEIWNKVLENNINNDRGYNIIIGARSSLFLPFNKLGLVIIDEEHDTSYKQIDMEPRYNARDSAVYLAHLFNANVILGSATPSIESYYNVIRNKFALVTLTERYGGIESPETSIVDMKKELVTKGKPQEFSVYLLEQIGNALENKQQVILYQNRRGFSLRLQCKVCGWIPQCDNCDVSLTYHKFFNQMRCHYCGNHTSIPFRCPNCNSDQLVMKGFGTEKIEETLQHYFPDAIIKRMDLDSTRRKNAFAQIISEFSKKKIDILVGTQMIIKGLDFNNVALVGVVNVDNLLYFPDFRSNERAFQHIVQVSGRAGRRDIQGKVILQTSSPDHLVIQLAAKNDYMQMVENELLERKKYIYPPYCRLIDIKLKHKDYKVLNEGALKFKDILKKNYKTQIVLGPEYYFIPRIKNKYIQCILIKIKQNSSIKETRNSLSKSIEEFRQLGNFKNINLIIDIDPY